MFALFIFKDQLLFQFAELLSGAEKIKAYDKKFWAAKAFQSEKTMGFQRENVEVYKFWLPAK